MRRHPPLAPADMPRVAPPTSLRDVPRYVKELLGGTFGRLFYIFRLLWESGRASLLLIVSVALLSGVLPVIGSVISRDILNEMQQSADLSLQQLPVFFGSMVFGLLLALFLNRMLEAIITRLSHAATLTAGERVTHHVRIKMMKKAKELDVASFDQPAFYEKMERANREAASRPVQVLSSALNFISAVILLVSYTVILLQAPDMWWIAPIILIVSLPSAIITFRYRRKHFQYMSWRSKERRQMNYYAGLMVNKDMVKELRLYDLGDTLIEKTESVFARYYKGLRRLIVAENTWHVVTTVISYTVNCGCFALIAWRVFRGELLIGDYTLLTAALSTIATQVSRLISNSSSVYEGTLFIDNLIAFLKEKQTVTPTLNPPRPVVRGIAHTITFEHVSFRYPGTDKDVLHDVDLTLRPGESLVLVGLNGAGKTTLLKLLTRLYDPTEGRILLDGYDLREYDVGQLYRTFGIIFQDYGRYAETAGENITFGDVHRPVDGEHLTRAARESGAATFIEELPDGYGTPLMRVFEQSGIELSIGQWQKLAISRAFYRECDVLILDEPTASLDPLAEQEIYNQFDRLRAGKTTIFVSHRLSGAVNASKIVVLQDGAVIEEGTHVELMAREGQYYHLFTTQAKRYRDTEADA